MMNRKFLWGLFSIFFILTIFADENRVLWDFGVVIKTPAQQSKPKINIKSLMDTELGSPSQVKALIANPFIPPTISAVDKKVFDDPNILVSKGEIPLTNIPRVKLLAGRLTMENNYQPIINMISQVDLSSLDESDYLDLNYWLANAYLHTGNYIESEDVILTNMEFTIDDRFHFLLAMTYEAQGRMSDAREEYQKFIIQFPQSDYTMAALIKSRILDRFK